MTFFLAVFLLLTLCASAQDSSFEKNLFYQQQPTSDLLKKLKPKQINYFSIFTGPSVGDLSDPVDEEGEIDENSLSTWNQVSFQWDLSEKSRFVFNPRFTINHNDPSGENIEMNSPVFGVVSTWYKNEKFSFGGGLNTHIPSLRGKDDRDDSIAFNPGGFNSLSYQINPRLSLGSWIWARALFYDEATSVDDARIAYFFAPQVNYALSDNTIATIFYQINAEVNNSYQWEFEKDESLNFLLTFKINSFLTIEPMLTSFRASNFSLKNSNINIWLSGRLF